MIKVSRVVAARVPRPDDRPGLMSLFSNNYPGRVPRTRATRDPSIERNRNLFKRSIKSFLLPENPVSRPLPPHSLSLFHFFHLSFTVEILPLFHPHRYDVFVSLPPSLSLSLSLCFFFNRIFQRSIMPRRSLENCL